MLLPNVSESLQATVSWHHLWNNKTCSDPLHMHSQRDFCRLRCCNGRRGRIPLSQFYIKILPNIKLVQWRSIKEPLSQTRYCDTELQKLIRKRGLLPQRADVWILRQGTTDGDRQADGKQDSAVYILGTDLSRVVAKLKSSDLKKNFLKVCGYRWGLLGLNSCQISNFPVRKGNGLKPICAPTPQMSLLHPGDPLVWALNLLCHVKTQAFPGHKAQAGSANSTGKTITHFSSSSCTKVASRDLDKAKYHCPMCTGHEDALGSLSTSTGQLPPFYRL